jgi:hypothetical protein
MDAGRTLPPPKKFAAELEVFAIKCLKEWKDEFGKDFTAEFEFVFKYLNKYKKVRGFETTGTWLIRLRRHIIILT